MAFVDYYKILGVDKNIPQKDVRAAYRKRAKQFHPDLHPNDPKAKAKFQALNEAYDVISDPDKRAKYDKYGEQWKNAQAYEQAGGGFGGFGGGSGGGNPFEGFDFSNFGSGGSGFSSFFENLFGGRGRSARAGAGAGAGSGFSGFGGGSGFGGFGGGAGFGGNAGSGYGAGPEFGTGGCSGGCGQNARQSNGEMHMNVNIDIYTALLGGEGIIRLSNGSKIKLKIKPETQNGTKVRVRGKGYDRGDGTFGDLIITYNVKIPTGLNERQKELLKQMKEAQ